MIIAGMFSIVIMAAAAPTEVMVDAGKKIAGCNRSDLLGVNVAAYNRTAAFEKAMQGVLSKLDIGLVRMPGGSLSDKCYWNGNGVVVNGRIDNSKYKAPYWQVDYSGYAPGFTVDSHDWGKATPMSGLDVFQMHRITRLHPVARNLVTVNAGSGTVEMAAEWVRWANLKNDFGVKHWEVGNELNGEWETGHIRPDGSVMTAEKYAAIFTEYAKAMKAVDPSIMIGGPSCDISHHDDYLGPLFKLAGTYIDFVTIHFYSLRSSLAPEQELFDGLDALPPITAKIHQLIAKYQPQRVGRIGICISEWNSKLPKDKDAYRLFNALWFSAWVGEMMKAGITSATVWDIFSDVPENGHGLLVRNGDGYVPTGRYWGFYLWSRFMGDSLVKSSVSGNSDLHVYATRGDGRLSIMVMNESRQKSYPLKMNVAGMKVAKEGRVVTLSSREYFWNPYRGEADWNYGPCIEAIKASGDMSMVIPPYSVRILMLAEPGVELPAVTAPPSASGKPELRLLLQQSGFGDLEMEGWLRVFNKGEKSPYGGNPGIARLSVTGNAEIEPAEVPLDCAAAKFILKPKGPGAVTVTAECNGLKVSRKVDFSPVKLTEVKVWGFNDGKLPQVSLRDYPLEVVPEQGRGEVLRVDFDGSKIGKKNHIYAVNFKTPAGIPKERIGGVIFDVKIPEDLAVSEKDATLQAVMQSTGAYWIPCGSLNLSEDRGRWRHIRVQVPDKKFLQVMDRAFSIRFVVSSGITMRGSLYLDNIGFLLRP